MSPSCHVHCTGTSCCRGHWITVGEFTGWRVMCWLVRGEFDTVLRKAVTGSLDLPKDHTVPLPFKDPVRLNLVPNNPHGNAIRRATVNWQSRERRDNDVIDDDQQRSDYRTYNRNETVLVHRPPPWLSTFARYFPSHDCTGLPFRFATPQSYVLRITRWATPPRSIHCAPFCLSATRRVSATNMHCVSGSILQRRGQTSAL
jgi:hypothetical protein